MTALIDEETDFATKINQEILQIAETGDLEKIKHLLNQRADPQYQDSKALTHATHLGQMKIIKHLVEQGANPQAGNSGALTTATQCRPSGTKQPTHRQRRLGW